MSSDVLIYRYSPGFPWSKRAGVDIPVPCNEPDESVLAIKYVFWPHEKSDGGAFDSGGLVFEVCGWFKTINPEGEASWRLSFSRAVEAPATVGGLFLKRDINNAGSVNNLFSQNTVFDVKGFPAESVNETYLSIDTAKKGMSLFYGIRAEFITVRIEQ